MPYRTIANGRRLPQLLTRCCLIVFCLMVITTCNLPWQILLVFVFMWVHTGSLFLSAIGMLGIILCFPFAFAIYRLVFQVRYFSPLQIMVIFLALGVGADDLFVFVDAWKQSAVVLGPNCDLERRMTWVYYRASKAMAVTSLTTALAFFITAANPIIPFSTLGIWAGTLVIALYVYAITAFPAAVVIWHRSLRLRSFATKCMLATSHAEQTDACVTREDDERDISNHIAADSGAAQIPSDAVSAENGGDDSVPSRRSPWFIKIFGVRREREDHEYRAIERFFRNKWVFWIHRIRYVVIALGFALIGISIYLSTQIDELSEEEKFLSDSNPLQIVSTLLKDGFPRIDSEYFVTVKVVHGVADVDRSGTSKYDLASIGRAALDTTFDLKPANAQRHIADICTALAANTELVTQETTSGNPPLQCWATDFKEWRALTNKTSDFEDYATDSALVSDLKKFFSYENTSATSNSTVTTPYFKYVESGHLGFTNGSSERVIYSTAVFETDQPLNDPYSSMFPFYKKWVAAIDAQNAQAPPSVSKAFPTAGIPWTFMQTARSLGNNAKSGVAIMLAIAFAVLTLSTLNVIVAAIATITVIGIVFNMLAIVFLMGWELGITVSIGVIVAGKFPPSLAASTIIIPNIFLTHPRFYLVFTDYLCWTRLQWDLPLIFRAMSPTHTTSREHSVDLIKRRMH
jgi:protein dispatched 1